MISHLLTDPHLWTAGAYAVIGAALMAKTLQIWWTHPINRAFLFGPYLTEAGVRLILNLLPMVWLFGLFIMSCAADHAADALSMIGLADRHTVRVLGEFEAFVSWATAMVGIWLLIANRRRR